MQIESPSFHLLFEQLGLPSQDQDIRAFITAHRPLDAETPLAEAPFWNASQARFLSEALAADSDWALPIDRLSQSLRGD